MTQPAMLTRVVASVAAPSLCILSHGMQISTTTYNFARTMVRKNIAQEIYSMLSGSLTSL